MKPKKWTFILVIMAAVAAVTRRRHQHNRVGTAEQQQGAEPSPA